MERAREHVSAAIREVLPEREKTDGFALARLGLNDLPDRIGTLSAGMLYSLVCDQQAVRLPLAAAALAASLQAAKPCVLVTPSDPAMFLRKARLAGYALGAHARRGELAIFQLAAEAGKRMFCAGAQAFVKELELSCAQRGAFLILDQADSLFMLPDPRASAEAAQIYLEWIASREHTALALFAPAAAAPRDYVTLRSIAENFAGFAVARSSDGGGSLEVQHWFASEGASPPETFPLRLHRSGTVNVLPLPAPQEDLPPVDSVIFVRGAMQAAPGAWQQADSAFEALQAARRSAAATLLLPFAQPGDYEELCRTVAALRAMARNTLRLAIRECGLRLRATQALALLRLGTSTIIPMELSDAAARRMVELLEGTRFARPYDTDIPRIEEETTLLVARECASVPQFCESVERLLAAADGFDVESCLVRVETDGADAAKLLSLARRASRDLVGVAQGDCVWLFILGCPCAALPALLKRLFSAQRAPRCSAASTPQRILMALDDLREEMPRAVA